MCWVRKKLPTRHSQFNWYVNINGLVALCSVFHIALKFTRVRFDLVEVLNCIWKQLQDTLGYQCDTRLLMEHNNAWMSLMLRWRISSIVNRKHCMRIYEVVVFRSGAFCFLTRLKVWPEDQQQRQEWFSIEYYCYDIGMKNGATVMM